MDRCFGVDDVLQKSQDTKFGDYLGKITSFK